MKKIKGFTLIELIVVMAILTILMLGIMQMMKPIRATFIDSTYYEMQRNTQNGMVTYLTETLRYADNIGIYSSGGVSAAINDFRTNVVGVTATELPDSKIHVLTIDNKTNYTYNRASNLHGRIVINKPSISGYAPGQADVPSSVSARVALSEAYYGASSYSIAFEPKKGNAAALGTTKPDSIKITVSSLVTHNRLSGRTTGTNDTGSIASQDQVVSTEGYIPLNNIEAAKPGSGKYKAPTTLNTTTNGQQTYIVFTLPNEH